MLYFVIHFFRLRYKYPSFKPYSITFSILSLGVLGINLGVTITKLDNAFPVFLGLNLPEIIVEPFVYTSTYITYIGLWFLGHRYLMNKVIKIPELRKAPFFISQRLLNILFFILILIIPTALGIILPSWLGSDNYNTVEGLFVIISQISLFTFLFFRKALLKEKEINLSKLTQARLELIASSALYQVSISIVIFFSALVAFSIPPGYDIYIEIVLLNSVHIFSILTCIKFYQAFHLPNKIRMKYGLTENRYMEFSKKLSESEA
jgi:hypothetical protein